MQRGNERDTSNPSSRHSQQNTPGGNVGGSSREFNENREGSFIHTTAPDEPILSRALSKAIARGDTIMEKRANSAFDYYQATGNYPVDYKYWWTPYSSDVGDTNLVMMHAVAYAEDGSEFGADVATNRKFMREAHKNAIREHVMRSIHHKEQGH